MSALNHARVTAVAVCLAFSGGPAEAKDNSGAEKTVRVIAKGANEEDARLNALRDAVRKGCGTSVVDATLREDRGDVGGTRATSTNQTEYFTGGRVSSSRILESSEEEGGGHRIVLDVVLAGCRSDGKIMSDPARPNSPPPKRKLYDKSDIYSKDLTVSIAYEVPAARISAYGLREIVLAVAKSFAVNVVKTDLASKLNSSDPVAPLSTRIDILNVQDLQATASEYGISVAVRVTMTGVSEEIDGNLVPDRPWRAASRNLRLSSRESIYGGFSYYVNPAEQNIVIYDVDKRGRSFGKLVPGDVIFAVNTTPLRVDENFDRFFDAETSKLPVKFSLKRGAVNSVVIVR